MNLRAMGPVFAVFAIAEVLVGSLANGLPLFVSEFGFDVNPAALDSLQVIGEFEPAPGLSVVFGDTDRDGMNEIIVPTVNESQDDVTRILELVPGGGIVLVSEVPGVFALASGDLDQDGKSDLVGQLGANIRVYESLGQQEHPSKLVWESPPISNQIGNIEIADTDSDGRLEIVFRVFIGQMRVIIFECEGDNRYALKYSSTPTSLSGKYIASEQNIYSPWLGDDLVFDLDGDGRPEIASGGLFGLLEIFESASDDVWERIYTDSTGLVSSGVVAGGVDMDADGKPELFVAGSDHDLNDRIVLIYQASGDRSFERVGILTTNDGATGPLSGAITRLEPGGKVRFVWQVYQQLRFYSAVGPGKWKLDSVIHDPLGRHSVYARDLNRNGRDEIYWVSNNRPIPSLILERPTFPTDSAGEPGPEMHHALRVWPSPCRRDAKVLLDSETTLRACAWRAFDASGRVVLEGDVRNAERMWVIPTQQLRPGIYFLQVTDDLGRPLATGRATVVR